MIDVRLYSLMKIVETGSYTKAAEQLNLSQPAVSQHIRQLEENLGVKLLEYSRNRLTLTPEGAIVVKYARRLSALSDNMRRALKNERDQSRSLTVGITHTIQSGSIVEALAACTSSCGRINMRILTNSTENLYTALKNYELDFAFVEGRTADPKLDSIQVDTDCLVLAVSPGHELAGRDMVTIDRLKKEKLILRLPRSNTRDVFEAALEGSGLRIGDFNVIMELDSVANICQLVSDGYGVSVLARSVCLSDVKKGRLAILNIESLSMMRETSLVYRKDFEHPDLLREIVRQYHEIKHA